MRLWHGYRGRKNGTRGYTSWNGVGKPGQEREGSTRVKGVNSPGMEPTARRGCGRTVGDAQEVNYSAEGGESPRDRERTERKKKIGRKSLWGKSVRASGKNNMRDKIHAKREGEGGGQGVDCRIRRRNNPCWQIRTPRNLCAIPPEGNGARGMRNARDRSLEIRPAGRH